MKSLFQGDVWLAEFPLSFDQVESTESVAVIGQGRRSNSARLSDSGVSETADSGKLRNPVVIVQGNAVNESKLPTVVCILLRDDLTMADAPGNVKLSSRLTGLPETCVADVSQIITLERRWLKKQTGRLTSRTLSQLLGGIDTLLGR